MKPERFTEDGREAVMVTKPWGSMAPGKIIYPNGVYRDALMRKGIVRLLRPDEYETRPIEQSPIDRMMRPRRGRPRKVT